MRVTRRQLRKLICEVISEDNNPLTNILASEEDKNPDYSRWAKLINHAVRGDTDDNFFYKWLDQVGMSPSEWGTDDVKMRAIMQNINANSTLPGNPSVEAYLDNISSSYKSMYRRDMRGDLQGDLGTDEISELNTAAPGFKMWMNKYS